MKINIIKLGLIALTVGALAPNVAKAQANPTGTYTAGDLIIGFYNNNYEFTLDLGAISNFNFATTFSIPDSATLINEDMTYKFGTSTWQSASNNIYFGLAASGNTSSAYVTDPVGNAAWSAAGTEGAVNGDLNSFGNQYSLASGGDNNQVSQGWLQAAGSNPGWKYYAGTGGQGGFSGNFGGPGYAGDTRINSLTSTTTNFDQLSSTSGEKTLGTWSVDSTGDLTFTAAAVPEPSTWASIVMGAAALIGIRRFRRA